eukprot:Rhum_TRINITY_DN14323_c0_g1::Rhum_TRINITY_DN14323_c0_g1_i3::g.80420::m.80420/K02218/CSNK1, CKI; casein kinase 1
MTTLASGDPVALPVTVVRTRDRDRDRDHDRDREHTKDKERERDTREKERRRRRKRAESPDSEELSWQGRVIDRFRIINRIGSGSYGDCYKGVDERTNTGVCLKLENSEDVRPKLHDEHQIMKLIEKRSAGQQLRLPRALHLTSLPPYNILVQDLLGPSLEDIFQKCDKSLDDQTVLLLAPLVIDAIEQVHHAGVIHKDIKPHNFLLGKGETAHKVYVIDFGLSKKYRSEGRHLGFRLGRNLTGTSRYVGLNIHRGYEASRRDDMESIGYMFMYLLKGRLPWQGVGGPGLPKAKRNEIIHTSKESTPLTTLCEGYPQSFMDYLRYCKSLEFTQEINYDYLRSLFYRDYQAAYGNGQDYSRYTWTRLGIYP